MSISGQELQNYKDESLSLLTSITHALVDDRGSVEIELTVTSHTALASITCHQKDVGKLIGKNGNNAQAIRQIMNAFSAKCGFRSVVQIVENR